jgi:hypothetical protein
MMIFVFGALSAIGLLVVTKSIDRISSIIQIVQEIRGDA